MLKMIACDNLPFDIDNYIREKIETKKAEKYAANRMSVYKEEMDDVRDSYNKEIQSLLNELKTAVDESQDTCQIKSTGHRTHRMSKWAFVSNKALDNFLFMLTQQGYSYEVSDKSRDVTSCGETEQLTDKYITIFLRTKKD
jgi:hypothetical protein